LCFRLPSSRVCPTLVRFAHLLTFVSVIIFPFLFLFSFKFRLRYIVIIVIFTFEKSKNCHLPLDNTVVCRLANDEIRTVKNHVEWQQILPRWLQSERLFVVQEEKHLQGLSFENESRRTRHAVAYNAGRCNICIIHQLFIIGYNIEKTKIILWEISYWCEWQDDQTWWVQRIRLWFWRRGGDKSTDDRLVDCRAGARARVYDDFRSPVGRALILFLRYSPPWSCLQQYVLWVLSVNNGIFPSLIIPP